MKCQEVHKLLVAYLDDEITPSERTLVRAHLAGCDACQQELAALSALQSRVEQFLQSRAASAAPSPQAWSRLQARLTREARPSPLRLRTRPRHLAPGVGRSNQIVKGGITMKKGFAFAAIVCMVIALSIVAFVPSVRAQVERQLLRWFRFEGPMGESVSIVGSAGFTPLRPTYLPAGFQSMAVGFNSESASLNYWNSATNQILVINEWVTSGDDRPLPDGAEVIVNGQRAVLLTGLEGSVTLTLLAPTPEPLYSEPPVRVEGSVSVKVPYPTPTPVAVSSAQSTPVPVSPNPLQAETVSYTDGRQLVWYVGNIRIEMLSNLPVEEMLKIAESMAPAEEG